MTAQEYRAVRERLGLTQGELADLLGVRLNTIYRREAGTFPITKEIEMALMYLEGTLRKRELKKKR